MYIDGLNLFDQAAAITTTAASTNVIDLSQQRDIGIGRPLKVLVLVTTTFTAAGAATLQVVFQGSTDNSTFTDMAATQAYALANLTAGSRLADWDVPRPAAGQAVPRYLRLRYIVATGPMTAGNITSALVIDRQDQYYYPPGVAISN